MKKISFYSIPLLTLLTYQLSAQCSFTPTITPNNPVLCPNETDTLWTQVYGSYQWYKGNNPINGATNQYYIVTQQMDVGFKFKVAATQNGCTAFSASVLVDEWAFTPPDLIITGDYGQYDARHDARVLCPGDTMILTLSQPYVLNDQWYTFGKIIAGATNETFYVTSPGSYTACGAPDMCPDYIACESLPLNAEFSDPKPAISQSNDTLFSTGAREYQWFENGIIIDGATNRVYVPASHGSYTVMITNRWFCSATSGPYDYIPRMENHLASGTSLAVFPNPAADVLHVQLSELSTGYFLITNLQGQNLLTTSIHSSEQTIPIKDLPAGMYILQCRDHQSKLVAQLFFMKE